MMDMSIPDAFAQAIRHYRSGHLEGAEKICKIILQASQHDKEVFEALRMLGAIMHRQKRYEEAKVHLEKAIVLEPNNPELYNNLSEISHKLEKPLEAEKAARQAISIQPNYAGAENNLGNALKQQNRLDEAADAYHRSLEICPNDVKSQNNLGNVLKLQGRLDEAIAAYARALEIDPNHADAQNALGLTLQAQGRMEEAARAFRQATARHPNVAEFANNLGIALREQGRFSEAEEAFRRALAIHPNDAKFEFELGLALQTHGRLTEAIKAYERALAIDPNYAEAEYNLGLALYKKNRLKEAMLAFQRALDIDPENADAENNLGIVLKYQGRVDEALDAYKRAVDIQPNFHIAHSNLLFTEQCRSGVSLAALKKSHSEWDRRHAEPLKKEWQELANTRDPDKRLRLGFVSADFWCHPVGSLSIGALESLKLKDCEIFCYSDVSKKDDLTSRIMAASGTWRETLGISDEELAGQIRADCIDILFDLAGHAGKRLLVFARKPAPIQVTWLGYPATTGMAAMDYILADNFLIPENSERHYCEKVIRMPDGFICFDPLRDAPDVGPLPALTEGYVTFGSFNNLAKITPEVVAVWAEILRRVPESRLVLKYKWFADKILCRRFTELFENHGVAPSRLVLVSWSPADEMMADYHRIDLALDTFPYTGSKTTCDALWMGVPVITCPGETFAGRQSLSYLSNIGLTETIATDTSDYVELAAGLAQDLPRLTQLRAGLRQRMANSQLCDGKRFAENLMKALRGVWREWCRGTPN